MAWMLFFAAGVASLWLLPALPAPSSVVLCTALSVPLGLLWFAWPGWLDDVGKATHARKATACLLALLAGFTYASWQAATAMAHTLPGAFDGQDFIVEGRVRGLVTRQALPRYDGSMATVQRFELDVAAIQPLATNGQVTQRAWPRRLRLSSYREHQFSSGEFYRLHLRLRSPRGLANPGSFDLRRYMLARQLDAQGYVRFEQVSEPLTQSTSLGSAAQQLRAISHRALQPAFAQSRHPQIYNALLLGDKSGLSAAVRTRLIRTGTAHLLAISGLHIGLAAGLGLGFGYALLHCCPTIVLRLPRSSVLALCSLPPAVFYAALAGLGVSTQRALIMLCSFALASLWQRHVRPFNHFCLALFSVLLCQPLAVFDSGFWLSFGAVAILLYCFARRPALRSLPPRQTLVKSKRSAWSRLLLSTRWSRSLSGALRAQMALFLGMPALLVAFGLPLPVVAPLANLLVVPIVACWVVPVGLCAVALSYYSVDATVALLQVADIGLALALVLLEFFASFGHWQLNASVAAPTLLIAISLCIVAVLLGPSRAPFYALAAVGWLSLFTPLAMLLQPESQKPGKTLQRGEFTLTQFDVGQGTAVLVSTRRQHWLYDTGGVFGQHSDAGRAVILPALRRLGIGALDGVIVSHGDKDHAGGAASVNSGIAVRQWYVGGSATSLAEQLQRDMQPCRAGLQWQVDGVRFAFIHPGNPTQARTQKTLRGKGISSENDKSCVLIVSAAADDNSQAILQTHLQTNRQTKGRTAVQATGRALLSGDISRAAERHLLRNAGPKLRADVVLVPHHGSKSSSSSAFVKHLNPQYALVSAGYNNRYGHPHADVLQRYKAVGSNILRSDLLGAIQLSFRGGGWQAPRCSRYVGRFFWQPWDNSAQCEGPLRKP